LPDIQVIVPTVPGREESLNRCVESFSQHGVEILIVPGYPTCGEAWIAGIKGSSAEYMLLCADDIEAHPDLDLAVCVEAVEDGYLPAPIVYRPDGTLESAGGDMAASACLINHIQPDWTPVDFTPMPFWSREQARKIRMIPAHYMTDVWASHRGRQLGYETVLRHDYKLIHHHELIGRRYDTTGDHRIYDEAMREANG